MKVLQVRRRVRLLMLVAQNINQQADHIVPDGFEAVQWKIPVGMKAYSVSVLERIVMRTYTDGNAKIWVRLIVKIQVV